MFIFVVFERILYKNKINRSSLFSFNWHRWMTVWFSSALTKLGFICFCRQLFCDGIELVPLSTHCTPSTDQ